MLKVGRGPAGAVAAVMASLCEQPEAVNKWGRAEGGGGVSVERCTGKRRRSTRIGT